MSCRFAEGIVLKMSGRGAKKFQAQQIFQEIIDSEIIDHQITILAMMNLAELLILELSVSDTPDEIFDELIVVSNKINQFA